MLCLSNLTACAPDTADLTQTCTEWDWLIIKTLCAETSNAPVTSSTTMLFWPPNAASPDTNTTNEDLFEYFSNCSFERPYRIVLPPVSCVYTKEKEEDEEYFVSLKCLSSTLSVSFFKKLELKSRFKKIPLCPHLFCFSFFKSRLAQLHFSFNM